MSISLGIIGLGNVAKAQINALTRQKRFKLVATYDLDPKKATLSPEGSIFYDTLDAFLSAPGLQIILISTPNESHFGLAMRGLEAGIPVIVEKPVCDNIRDLATLRDTARKREVQCFAALHFATAYEVMWLEANIATLTKDFGELTGFVAQFYDPYIYNDQLASPAKSLQCAWLDSAINSLSVIDRFIPCSKVSVIGAQRLALEVVGREEIQASGYFHFPRSSGAVGAGIIDTNWYLKTNAKTTRFIFDESHTEIVLEHVAQRVFARRGDSLLWDKRFDDGQSRLANHYVGVFSHIAEQIDANNGDNLDAAYELHRVLFQAHGWGR